MLANLLTLLLEEVIRNSKKSQVQLLIVKGCFELFKLTGEKLEIAVVHLAECPLLKIIAVFSEVRCI